MSGIGTYGGGTYGGGGGVTGTYGSGGSPSPLAQRMMTYIPGLFYEDSTFMNALMEAEGLEFDQLRAVYRDIRKQFYVRTATWALPYWEDFVGIIAPTSATYQERQDRLVSRLRGYGTATEDVVTSVAKSYVQGDVTVIDDYDNYVVLIEFVDTIGVPSNITDLQAALRAVVPAHLDIHYQFRFAIWDHLDALNLTWDALDSLGMTWDQFDIFV